MVASGTGHLEIVQALLAKGADVNAKTSTGDTALSMANSEGRQDIVEVLKKAGIEEADVFVAATQGDNRNVMACQIAKHIYHVPKVVSRIYDPIREEMYRNLGLKTVSPTKVVAKLLKDEIKG